MGHPVQLDLYIAIDDHPPSFLQMTVGQCLRVILTMAVVSLLFASPIFLNTHFHIPILDTDTTAAAAADYESQGKPHLRVGTFTDKVPCVSSEQSRSAQSVSKEAKKQGQMHIQ